MSGRRRFAREQVAYRQRALFARETYVHRRVYVRVVRVIVGVGQESRFHGRGDVEQHDDFVELLAHHVQHFRFVLVQLQVVVGVGVRAFHARHDARHVEALAAYARDDHDRGVRIVREAVPDVAVLGHGRLRGRYELVAAAVQVVAVGRALCARTAVVLIELFERGIDREARALQTFVQAYRARKVAAARSRVAVREVDGVLTEHRHARAARERQHVVLRRVGIRAVLEQYRALLFQTDVHGVGVLEGLRFAVRERRGIHGHHALGVYGLRPAEREVEHRREYVHYEQRHHQREHDQEGRHARPYDGALMREETFECVHRRFPRINSCPQAAPSLRPSKLWHPIRS